jgi:glyoxylase-like metal-dependent hydrolase (beta-lactamase superfamily II)
MHEKAIQYVTKGITKTPKGVGFLMKMVEIFGNTKIGQWYMSYDSFKINSTEMPDIGEVVYTPGHSDDSVSLVMEVGDSKKTKIAFVGDLFRRPQWITHIGIGVNAYFCDEPDEQKKSVKTLIDKGVELFIPSHGTPIRRKEVMELFKIKD